MKPEDDKIVLTVRLYHDEHEILRKLAIKEDRSMSQQVRSWIRDASKKRGPRPLPPGRSLID